MKFIGITGGVGAGKSAVLEYLAKKPKTRVLLADEIAHMLMEPGTECYHTIYTQFANEDIYLPKTLESQMPAFDRAKLATVIFQEEAKRKQLNDIVHPAVKDYVRKQYALETQKGELKLLVLEAALLIEEDYDEICDELWYIYTKESIRKMRLMETRGYSEEKVALIFKSQLSEAEFRANTQVTIYNNGDLETTFQQIEKALRRETNE